MEINNKIFRAYDIRGIYPDDLDENTVRAVGEALAGYFEKGKIIVAHDVRKSSPTLYKALCEALKERDVIKLGLSTTPMFYYFAAKTKTTGGIMITASHNPKEWNGMKIVAKKVWPISGKILLKIVSDNLKKKKDIPKKSAKKGKTIKINSPLSHYADFLKKQIKIKGDKKIKIVVDASNGYAGEVMKKALRGIKNLKTIYLSVRPDGEFPDHGPNPNAEGSKDNLIAAVKAEKADLGIIFDGDGDRVIFVDDKGEWFDPDAVVKMYADHYRPEKIVIDEITGMLPTERKNYAKGCAPKVFRLRVGHLYIKEAMIKRNAEFGAERSGHYYFHINGAYFDSGAVMAGRMITAVSAIGKISEWLATQKKYYRSGEINMKVSGAEEKKAVIERVKKYYEPMRPKIEHKDGLTLMLPGLRINIRPSGTENLLRVNIEADTAEELKKEIEAINKIV